MYMHREYYVHAHTILVCLCTHNYPDSGSYAVLPLTEETEEGGEVTYVLNDWNRYCKDFVQWSTYCTHIATIYECTYVPYLQLTCWLRVAIVETEEGGEVSHALNDWNMYCKDFNSLCSKVTACLSKHSEWELFKCCGTTLLVILHTTVECCRFRPPGESNTWAQVKCLIFTFFT